jgi:hypothetical protein
MTSGDIKTHNDYDKLIINKNGEIVKVVKTCLDTCKVAG